MYVEVTRDWKSLPCPRLVILLSYHHSSVRIKGNRNINIESFCHRHRYILAKIGIFLLNYLYPIAIILLLCSLILIIYQTFNQKQSFNTTCLPLNLKLLPRNKKEPGSWPRPGYCHTDIERGNPSAQAQDSYSYSYSYWEEHVHTSWGIINYSDRNKG